MNYEDEHYVRVYTRDTKTWLKLGWEGQCTLMMLLRKTDKAGVLDDIDHPVSDLALITGLPESVVEIGLERLLRANSEGASTVEIIGSKLVLPNYLEAQTAARSDKARAQLHRGRRRAAARNGANSEPSDSVTERDEVSRNVTAPSQSVTERHKESRGVTPASPNAMQRIAIQSDLPPLPTVASPQVGNPESPSDSPPKPTKKKTKPKRKWTRAPADFEPTDAHRALASELGVNLAAALAKFRDHEYRSPKTDADAAFRTWLRNTREFAGGGRRAPPVQRGVAPGAGPVTRKYSNLDDEKEIPF